MLINTSKLFFEDQLTPTGFDPFKPTGETFNSSTLTSHYLDLNAGCYTPPVQLTGIIFMWG